MQSAGFTETRQNRPLKNFTKATKRRLQAEFPHFVYSLLCTGNYFSIN